jgi:cytidylate kinase
MAGGIRGLAADDEAGHAAIAATLDARFESDAAGKERVLLDGREVTLDLRTESAGAAASRVAAMPSVRASLLGRQRAFAAPPGLVADGRDMGTVVFTAAPVKIFLTASAEERALRRYKQLKGKGLTANLADLSQEILDRDRRDTSRPVAPLRPASDALILDSTGMPIEAVVERILAVAGSRVPVVR